MSDDFDFDPFDPARWDDPYPAYRVMREQHPVYRHATPYGRVWSHYWMLSRAADVNGALSDWRRFSSARGVLVDTDLTGVSTSPPLFFDADPPVQGLARTRTEDVTLHDVTIPAGEQVLPLFGSANHDETVFDHGDVLDFDREVGLHSTFGHGLHHCLGSAVAKLETRVAVQVLLKELRDWEIDDAAAVRSQLVPTRGVAHAPASCSPGPRR